MGYQFRSLLSGNTTGMRRKTTLLYLKPGFYQGCFWSKYFYLWKNERFTTKLLRNGTLLKNLEDIFSSCQDNINIKIPTTSRRNSPYHRRYDKITADVRKGGDIYKSHTAPPTLRINSIPCGAKIHAMPPVIGYLMFFFIIGGVKKYPLLPGVISPTIIPPICEKKTLIYFILSPSFWEDMKGEKQGLSLEVNRIYMQGWNK